jgi:hypothetical protein
VAEEFVSGLLEAAEDLVDPLREAVDSPENLSALLARLGWTSPLVQDAADVLSTFPALFDDIENAVEQVAQADESGSLTESQIADLIGYAIDAIRALTQAIDALKAPKGLGPPFDDAFWAVFPEELVDYLIARYLAVELPKLYGLLVLAGIVSEEHVDPNAQYRVPYLERKVHWDRLPTAVTDPVSLMPLVYGWGTDEFDWKRFLQNVGGLLGAFGVPNALDAPGTALDTYYPATAFDRQFLNELVAQVLMIETDDGSALGLATLSLHALPIPPKTKTGLPSGFALFPEIDGSLSSGAITIVDGVAIQVGGEFHTAPIVVEVRPTGVDVTTGLTTFDAAVTLEVQPAQPLILLGTAGSSRFELAKAHATLGAKGPTGGELEYRVGAGLDSAALVIDLGKGDGFLQKMLGGEPQSLTFGVAVMWSSVSGFRFQGQARLAVKLPVHLTILEVLEIDTIGIVVGASMDGDLTLEATVTGGLTLGPFAAQVDQIGAKLALEPRSDNSGSLGAFDLGFGFRPPSGLGFVLDAGPVVGGGYVSFDPDNEEYAGILQLELSGTFALKAIGLLTTKMPDGSKGFSMMLIITAEFSPIQLGYGFTLNGVGGALGLNRTMKTEVLRSGIHSGALESLLFPPDPVAHATEVISNLRSAFPVAEGQFIFGPMAKLGWGASIITLELGILLELPDPVRLAILGRLKVALPPGGGDAVLVLQLDVLGIIDFGSGDISIDATLFGSRIVDFPITGDMAVRANVGNHPNFALAAGGFHPSFMPPPGFPPLQRLGVQIASGDNPRLILGSYFALTTNTAQFGAGIDAYAGFSLGALGTFSVTANLAFDALFHFVPFSMEAVLDGMASLKHNEDELAGAKIHLEFTGPTPWRAVGTASIQFWGTHDVHVELTVGEDTPEAVPAPADPAALLLAALGVADAWGTVAPGTDHALVTVRDVGKSAIVVHPLGELSVHQRVAPLGVNIQRIGTSPVPGGVTLGISAVTVTGVTTTRRKPLFDDFAPAQFFDLSDDDKLSRPAFERLDAGTRVQTAGFARGGARDGAMAYETVVVDDRATKPAVDHTYSIADGTLHALAEHGPAGTSVLTTPPRFVAEPAGISTTGAGYVVAGRDDLAPAAFAREPTSYSVAADALATRLSDHPEDEGAYHIVGSHEAA